MSLRSRGADIFALILLTSVLIGVFAVSGGMSSIDTPANFDTLGDATDRLSGSVENISDAATLKFEGRIVSLSGQTVTVEYYESPPSTSTPMQSANLSRIITPGEMEASKRANASCLASVRSDAASYRSTYVGANVSLFPVRTTESGMVESGFVVVGNTTLSAELVRRGFAVPVEASEVEAIDADMQAQLREAESQARADKKGVWRC